MRLLSSPDAFPGLPRRSSRLTRCATQNQWRPKPKRPSLPAFSKRQLTSPTEAAWPGSGLGPAWVLTPVCMPAGPGHDVPREDHGSHSGPAPCGPRSMRVAHRSLPSHRKATWPAHVASHRARARPPSRRCALTGPRRRVRGRSAQRRPLRLAPPFRASGSSSARASFPGCEELKRDGDRRGPRLGGSARGRRAGQSGGYEADTQLRGA